MDMEIRKATLKDLETIQKLNLLLCEKEEMEYQYGIDLGWSLGKGGTAYFKSRITGNDACSLVALLEGRVIGYLVGGITKPEDYRKVPKTAEIGNMFVLEEFRSTGTGTKLYEEFRKWCKERGVGLVKVEAHAKNSRAVDFYRKMGLKDYTLILEGRI
jgi:GNAT superfamily N-acetyltransferase